MPVPQKIASYLNSLKPVSPHLMEILNSLDTGGSVLDVGRKLSLDPVLSARLIHACSSPLYGIKKKIESPVHAVAMLGINKVAEILLTSELKKNFFKGHFSTYEYDFWEHSLAIAYGTQALIRCMGFEISLGKAFTTGLLHDLGKIILYKIYKDNAELASWLAAGGNAALLKEKEIVGCNHVEVMTFALIKWGIPIDVVKAIKDHHNFKNKDDMTRIIQWAHFAVYGKEYPEPPVTSYVLKRVRQDISRDLELVDLFFH